jgi:O-antigen ligase
MDRVLAITALFFVVIGFATWIVGYPIALPLLPQTSQYWVGVDYGSLYGGIAFRIGQLQTFGPLLVLWALAKIPKGFFGRILRIAIVSLGLLAAFLSGGRSNFVGLMLTLPVYAVLLARRRIWTEMLWLSGILGIGIIVIQSTLPGQFERITTAFLSFEQQDPYRTILFDIYWQGFEDSPIFGQGIGSKTEVLGYAATSALGDAEFFSQQIITGGHGSYLSILFVFGLLGAIPWFGLLTTALIASFRLARDRAEEDSVPGFWSRLTFLYLISILPAFAVGGNGYDAAWTYLVMGIVAALVTRRNSIVESGQPG